MAYASWISDLASLTWLILGILAFILALAYRSEIKALLPRVRNFEAKRKDTVLRAELSGENPDGDDQEEPQPEAEEAGETKADQQLKDSDPPPQSEKPEIVDPETLRQAMVRSFAARENEEGERQFEQLVSLTPDPVEAKRDQARRYAGLFMGGGDQSALAQLRQHAGDPEVAGFAYQMIGVCLEKAQMWADAAEAFANAAERAGSPGDQAAAVVGRARALAALGEFNVPLKELRELLSSETDVAARATLWEGWAEVHKKAGNLELNAIALHQVAEIAVNDSRKWFYAGYAYAEIRSDANFALMAVYCYRNAIKFDDRFAAAQNNLAARLSTLDLRLVAMEYYREAANLGHTLAMANIGQAYLNAGFGAEAKQILEEATSRPKAHPNVATHLATLASERTKQEERISQLEVEGARLGDTMTAYACAAVVQKAPDDLVGQWILETGLQAHVELSQEGLVVSWTVADLVEIHRRFVGRLVGSAASGRFEKMSKLVSTGERWEADGTGVLVVDKDRSRIRLTRLNGTDTEYLYLRRSA
jgi:tetratricopeptide (TPR) repeat protein